MTKKPTKYETVADIIAERAKAAGIEPHYDEELPQ